jgi:signal transduction histidine kinase
MNDQRAVPHAPRAILLQSLERAPIAYAATCAPHHTLFFANAEFRRLTNLADDAHLRQPFREIFPQEALDGWLSLLDQAMLKGTVTTDAEIPAVGAQPGSDSWRCNIWPVEAAGSAPYCVIEVHEVPLPDHTLLAVAEQLLLTSLRESEVARVAERARSRAVFLADATKRLTESLDVEMTLGTIALLALPSELSWCIVDVIANDGSIRRVAIVHPNGDKQIIADQLSERWYPQPDDFFGAALAMKLRRSRVIEQVSDTMLVAAAHSDENARLLRQLEFTSLLVVPLMVRGDVIGAVTFVKGRNEPGFTESDVELAETVSARSALALDNARLYGEAEWLRIQAEQSNRAKSEFLKRMSHELRTPLNAILGYVELMEMGLHGPVTDQQRNDLERIRKSNSHLLALITDILDYTQVRATGMQYHITDVPVPDVLRTVISMLDSLIQRKQIVCELVSCPEQAIARTDAARLEQIVINLVTNAIKYSQRGAHIRLECVALPDAIEVRVIDDGPGIAEADLDTIFEPFVQVGPVHMRTEGGIGLGLAISRELALAMQGTLTVQSVVGSGTTFILTLPRAR